MRSCVEYSYVKRVHDTGYKAVQMVEAFYNTPRRGSILTNVEGPGFGTAEIPGVLDHFFLIKAFL